MEGREGGVPGQRKKGCNTRSCGKFSGSKKQVHKFLFKVSNLVGAT